MMLYEILAGNLYCFL